jgi:hypothetical protein
VRFAALALSAMARALRELACPTFPLPRDAAGHSQVAFKFYAEAIELCRQKLFASDGSLFSQRELLLANLLFIIFELGQGNLSTANTLIVQGIQLSRDSVSMEEQPASDITNIEVLFQSLSLRCSLTPFFSFQRTMYQPRGLLNLPPVPPRDTPPSQLVGLWEPINRQIQAFVRPACHEFCPEIGPRFEHTRQRQLYSNHLQAWTSLVAAAVSHRAEEQVRSNLHIIRCEILRYQLFIDCGMDLTGAAFDSAAAQFDEIVSLIAEERGPRLLIDLRVLPLLCFIIRFCRYRDIRYRALDVFNKHFGYGSWSPLAKALTSLVELEEASRDSYGMIPLSRRYFWEKSDWDSQKNRLIAHLLPVGPWSTQGALEMRDLLIDL